MWNCLSVFFRKVSPCITYFSTGEKDVVLAAVQGRVDGKQKTVLGTLCTSASGPSAEFSIKFSNKSAVAPICAPSGKSLG